MSAVETELLPRIDAYLDSVPRSVAQAEHVGPFTLFVNEGAGWRYYARPTPGVADEVRPADVAAVRARQRALRQPEVLEWLVQIVPGLGEAAEAAGMQIRHHPLMLLDAPIPIGIPPGVDVILVSPHDDLARFAAVAQVGFATPGMGVGRRDDEAYDAAVASADPEGLAVARERMREGFSTMAAATIEGRPVTVGSFQPRDGVAEIVGVATLPGYRRRGLAAAVTSALVREAMDHDVRTIFLSADDETVARVYARIGFRIVGTAGEAVVAS